jgi:hypothetical protein
MNGTSWKGSKNKQRLPHNLEINRLEEVKKTMCALRVSLRLVAWFMITEHRALLPSSLSFCCVFVYSFRHTEKQSSSAVCAYGNGLMKINGSSNFNRDWFYDI